MNIIKKLKSIMESMYGASDAQLRQMMLDTDAMAKKIAADRVNQVSAPVKKEKRLFLFSPQEMKEVEDKIYNIDASLRKIERIEDKTGSSRWRGFFSSRIRQLLSKYMRDLDMIYDKHRTQNLGAIESSGYNISNVRDDGISENDVQNIINLLGFMQSDVQAISFIENSSYGEYTQKRKGFFSNRLGSTIDNVKEEAEKELEDLNRRNEEESEYN